MHGVDRAYPGPAILRSPIDPTDVGTAKPVCSILLSLVDYYHGMTFHADPSLLAAILKPPYQILSVVGHGERKA